MILTTRPVGPPADLPAGSYEAIVLTGGEVKRSLSSGTPYARIPLLLKGDNQVRYANLSELLLRRYGRATALDLVTALTHEHVEVRVKYHQHNGLEIAGYDIHSRHVFAAIRSVDSLGAVAQ